MSAIPEHKPSVESRVGRYLYYDRINRPYLEWQAEQFLPFVGRRVLEVGCGVGSILDLLAPRDLLFGVDIDTEVLEAARDRFAGRPEFRFAVADTGRVDERLLAELKSHRFDTIVTINVLEHVEDDLAALRRMEEIVLPGGAIAILVPAHPGLYGKYDQLDGHFRRYAKRDLAKLVGSTGLRLERLHHFNSVGAAGWWFQYKLMKRQIHDEGQFSLMNRLVPAFRALERRIKPPFGLSLVAIARKPEQAA